MAYTAELSRKESAILRRIARALQRPMTVALSFLIEMRARYADKERVSSACKDNSFCKECSFSGREVKAVMEDDPCPYCGKAIEYIQDYFAHDSDPQFDCPHCKEVIQGFEEIRYILTKKGESSC